MATLSTQTMNLAGASVTYTAAASGGDKATPSRRTFLHVKNEGASAVTVTVDDTLSVEPSGAISFDPDIEVTIEAGADRFIGPIVETRFQGSDGLADISYDQVDSVSIAIISV